MQRDDPQAEQPVTRSEFGVSDDRDGEMGNGESVEADKRDQEPNCDGREPEPGTVCLHDETDAHIQQGGAQWVPDHPADPEDVRPANPCGGHRPCLQSTRVTATANGNDRAGA